MADSRVQCIEGELTVRWSFRDGDSVFWLRMVHDPPEPSKWTVQDVWMLRDGDWATVTTRAQDVPIWFDLHSDDVGGEPLQSGSRQCIGSGVTSGDPLNGPNIWRAKAGDRLVWTGLPRPDNKAIDNILAILDFRECALVVGESNREPNLLLFGELRASDATPEATRRGQAGVRAAIAVGEPSVIGTSWALRRGQRPTSQCSSTPDLPEPIRAPAPQRLTIVVNDNFHYQDESESYTLNGTWTNLDEAIRVCQAIVESSLDNCYEPGMTAEKLLSQYRHFGDDPWIRGGSTDGVPFSAWTYAEERCEGFVAEKEAVQDR